MSFHCSMGGAIAVHTAVQELVPTLAGLVVIDVVEGLYLFPISISFYLLK